MRAIATAVLIASTLLLIACGGDDKPDTATLGKQDSEAKSNALNLVSELEVCFVENQDYSSCKKPPGTKLRLGTGKGQVEVKDASTSGYTVVARSKSGASFTLQKSGSGATKRTCKAGGSEEGGCKGGRW